MASGNVYYLERNLPATRSELPFRPTTSDKIDGMRSFTLRGSSGSGTAMGGRVTTIYYLDEHDRDTVIRAFLDANPQLVDSKTQRGLMGAIGTHGQPWQRAARAVLDEIYEEERESTNSAGFQGGDRECGLCGEPVAKNQYPNHLATECEKTE